MKNFNGVIALRRDKVKIFLNFRSGNNLLKKLLNKKNGMVFAVSNGQSIPLNSKYKTLNTK